MGATYFKNALSASREHLKIDWDALEEAWAEREKQIMAKVVLVRDLAIKLNQDRSHMSRKIRIAKIQTVDVRDSISGQMVKAVHLEDVDAVRALYEEAVHEIVPAGEIP